jgi:hypothetical protein
MRSLKLKNETYTESFVLAMSTAGIDFNKYDTKIILEAHQAYILAPAPDNRADYALRIFNKHK